MAGKTSQPVHLSYADDIKFGITVIAVRRKLGRNKFRKA
jgi:hypothetical protein